MAIAFAWLSFGPGVALARVAAAASVAAVVALLGRMRRANHARDAGESAMDAGVDLPGIALAASSAAIVAGAVAGHALGGPAAVALGLALGLLAPCATAGVALAAGLASHAPASAIALLAVSGIVPGIPFGAPFARTRSGAPSIARRSRSGGRSRGGAFGRIALAFALGTLALRGPSGLVSPRLVPVAAAGAIAALLSARRATNGSGDAVAAAVMLAAIVLGSPQPAYTAAGPAVADGFPGEAVGFTGVERGARVERFAIACCRLDARPVGIELAGRVAPDGTWVTVAGRFAERRGRLIVLPDRVRRIRPPDDPYLYL